MKKMGKMMSTRICVLMLVAVLIVASAAPVMAAEYSQIEGMLPVRPAFEGAGFEVSWDDTTKEVHVGEDGMLTFSPGSKVMRYEGVAVTMYQEPKLVNGRCYVDEAFLRDFFGLKMEKGTNVVTIPDAVREVLMSDYQNRSEIYSQPVEGEAEFLSALHPQTGWDIAKELGKIGSSPLGFRLGGTPEGKAAADVMYNKFKEFGLEPEYDTFTMYGWRFLDASFTLADSDMQIPVVSAVGTKATPKEGITGEVIFVGAASKEELEGVDLTGKIALIGMDLDIHPWQSQGAYAAWVKGAAGVIYYCENYYGQLEGGEAFNVQDWSGAEIDIPVLNTPKKYGEALRELILKSPQTACLVSQVEIEEKATGYNVIGKIEGAKYPDEYVIVNAHTDAYFEGFQDDSIAIGGIAAIAEAMQKSGYKPDRTILFLSMDGEEFGAMDVGSDWLLGSWNMMKEKNTQWAGKTAASLTIELFGYKGTEKFEMRSGDPLYEYVVTAAEGFDYEMFNGLGLVRNEISNMSDEFSFAYYGIPTFRTNTDPFVAENLYHSQLDNEENTSFEKYSEALSHYAKLLIRIDKMPATPYDLTLGIRKYNQSVNYQGLAQLGFSNELQTLVQTYQEKARELYFKNTYILKLYEDAKATGEDMAAIDNLLVAYNQKARDTLKTYLTGTLAMGGDTVSLAVPFYQKFPGLLDNAMNALKQNNPEEALELLSTLPGSYYAEYEDYETWKSWNVDNHDPDNPERDTLWTENIRLRHFDHYQLLEALKDKIASGDTDFSEEIKTCETFKASALKDLQAAYQKNVSMFKQANGQFPLEEANVLIEALIK